MKSIYSYIAGRITQPQITYGYISSSKNQEHDREPHLPMHFMLNAGPYLRLLETAMYTPYAALVDSMGTFSISSAADLSTAFLALISAFVTAVPT